ncbi:AHH domain-containing protein [uncultured Dokdonia sp.]|uniref:AHH domain-containing protein n=1 Tax=uncultured Dokdonia sp. TaxID=575653 RepID=UPI0026229B1B|nr:AHH domain-containing protein [uncultured Dokdonia sp.]
MLSEKAKNKGGKQVGDKGKFVTESGDEIEGILIGGVNKKSGFVDDLFESSKNTDGLAKNQEEFAKLFDETDDAVRKKMIQGAEAIDYEKLAKEIGEEAAKATKNRGQLAKSIGKAPSKFHQAHHLLPVELLKRSKILQKAVDGGFDFNGLVNGKWVKLFSGKIDELKDGIHASHPKYTDKVLTKMEEQFKVYREKILRKSKFEDVTEIEAKVFMNNFAKNINKEIDKLIEINKSLPLDQKIKLNDINL